MRMQHRLVHPCGQVNERLAHRISDTLYSSGLMLGVGAEYALTKQLSVRGEYQRPASNLYVLSAGLKYGF